MTTFRTIEPGNQQRFRDGLNHFKIIGCTADQHGHDVVIDFRDLTDKVVLSGGQFDGFTVPAFGLHGPVISPDK